jgi:hypothetical protein
MDADKKPKRLAAQLLTCVEEQRERLGDPKLSEKRRADLIEVFAHFIQVEYSDFISALVEARLQLEYLDEKFSTGTTPRILSRLNYLFEQQNL